MLYGLKQALRAWHLKLTAQMESLGFRASVADPSLFVKKAGEETVYVAVCVDDCLGVGKKEAVRETKKSIGEKVTVRDLGAVRYFVEMEVTQNKSAKRLKLMQKREVTDLLEEIGMEFARLMRVPMSPGKMVQKDGELLNTKECPYAKLVGSLANCTRPDIAQSVGVYSRYISCATNEHWRLGKSVLSYLAGTTDVGLEYGSKPLGLESVMQIMLGT
jgi:hypothetical protein